MRKWHLVDHLNEEKKSQHLVVKILLKAEYHVNENILKNSEKIAYVGQMSMCTIIIKKK